MLLPVAAKELVLHLEALPLISYVLAKLALQDKPAVFHKPLQIKFQE
jgi:hypothetical protein